jgi:hypothetical protein
MNEDARYFRRESLLYPPTYEVNEAKYRCTYGRFVYVYKRHRINSCTFRLREWPSRGSSVRHFPCQRGSIPT